jgi:hypothetical protein|tara:strand:+ start:56 stop:475 length:420 start_codon:yes stop_codon:yes gene_type:complete
MEEKRKIEILLNHVGSSVTHDYNDVFNCDYHLLSEITADGYEVYTFKEPNEEYNISENIHYYNTRLGERVVETLLEGNKTVFLDDLEYDGLFIQELLFEEFEEYVDDIIQEIENGGELYDVTISELKELKEEYELNIEL